ncbi:mitogen-activated protein kinase-binding protein 1, partial [Tanacetum coccineum]
MTVPAVVLGFVFLSGGESKGEATVNLNAMKLAANQHRGHSSWIVLCIKLMERGILAYPTHNATIRLTSPLPIRYDFIISNRDFNRFSAGTFERESVVSGVITKGYQSMTVSSDGKHLAAGDSDGNLYIFNLCTSDYTCIQIGYTCRRNYDLIASTDDHSASVSSVKLTANGRKIVCCYD